MEAVTKYVADDGQEFWTRSACLEHELRCLLAALATTELRGGASLADALKLYGVSNERADVFSEVSAKTGFYVPYFQCREQVGYKVRAIRHDGRVHLGGDVGGHRGAYWAWVTLGDLERYWRDTQRHLAQRGHAEVA